MHPNNYPKNEFAYCMKFNIIQKMHYKNNFLKNIFMKELIMNSNYRISTD